MARVTVNHKVIFINLITPIKVEALITLLTVTIGALITGGALVNPNNVRSPTNPSNSAAESLIALVAPP